MEKKDMVDIIIPMFEASYDQLELIVGIAQKIAFDNYGETIDPTDWIDCIENANPRKSL